MRIKGLQKTTLLDYPGHVAATIFLGGCNFLCPFCHNMNIVDEDESDIPEDEIIDFIKKRSSLLDGVCITGGEPTLNDELEDFLRGIKSISDGSLLIKLDTNGTNPEMIERLINERLIDYIAMDVKSSKEKYYEAIGLSKEYVEEEIIKKIEKSIGIIMNSDIEYEFRTTVMKRLHDEKTIEGIGKMIYGAKRHYIQSFVDSEYVKDHTLEAYDNEELYRFREIIGKSVMEANVRGVD